MENLNSHTELTEKEELAREQFRLRMDELALKKQISVLVFVDLFEVKAARARLIQAVGHTMADEIQSDWYYESKSLFK